MTDDTPVNTAKGTRPARGYKWESFTEGNKAALRHGAHSPGVVDQLASSFAQRAVDASPALGLERFSFALAAWARAEARCELLSRYLDSHDIQNNRGTPRQSVLTHLAASERAAQRGRSELGLSPESASRIALMIRAAGVELLSPEERRALLPHMATVNR